MDILRAWASWWLVERAGSIPVVFALTIVPVISLAGAGIDMASAVQQRQSLQAAADSASLAAARVYAKSRTADLDLRLAEAKAAADSYFNANAAGTSGRTGGIAVNVAKVTDGIRVTVDGQVGTSFLKVAGIEQIPVSVSSEAIAAVGNLHFHIMIDASPTMTLPSEPDVYAPVDRSGCFFSCHDDGSLTRAQGLVPKMDVIRSMLTELVDTVDTNRRQRRIDVTYSVYTFNASVSSRVAATDDVDDVETFLASPLVLGGSGTDINRALTHLKSQVTTLRGQSYDEHIVILISDGSHERAPAAFNGQLCRDLEAAGATIYTVYIENGEWAYDNPNASRSAMATIDWNIVRNGGRSNTGWHSGIARAGELMSACASNTEFAFGGEFADEIENAFSDLIESVIASKMRLAR